MEFKNAVSSALSVAEGELKRLHAFERLADALRNLTSYGRVAEEIEARLPALQEREAVAKADAEKAEANAIAVQEETYASVLAAQGEADRLIREAKEDSERESEASEATVKALRAEVEAVKAECDFKVKELREDVAAEELKLRAARARYDEFLASIKG